LQVRLKNAVGKSGSLTTNALDLAFIKSNLLLQLTNLSSLLVASNFMRQPNKFIYFITAIHRVHPLISDHLIVSDRHAIELLLHLMAAKHSVVQLLADFLGSEPSEDQLPQLFIATEHPAVQLPLNFLGSESSADQLRQHFFATEHSVVQLLLHCFGSEPSADQLPQLFIATEHSAVQLLLDCFGSESSADQLPQHFLATEHSVVQHQLLTFITLLLSSRAQSLFTQCYYSIAQAR
jgi:hypothetical protein